MVVEEEGVHEEKEEPVFSGNSPQVIFLLRRDLLHKQPHGSRDETQTPRA